MLTTYPPTAQLTLAASPAAPSPRVAVASFLAAPTRQFTFGRPRLAGSPALRHLSPLHLEPLPEVRLVARRAQLALEGMATRGATRTRMECSLKEDAVGLADAVIVHVTRGRSPVGGMAASGRYQLGVLCIPTAG